MAGRLLTEKLIPRDSIIEPLVLIQESQTDYITPSGLIYKDYGNNMMFPKKNFVNKNNGYLYCNITTPEGQKQKRVHILVAQAYLDNPNHYTIVGHKDNNKTNPLVDNLYWTTTQENTKKAFNDGLAKNDSSFDDSQSIAVCAFTLQKELYKIYGSIGECAKDLGATKTGILYQCNHQMKTKPRKGYYYRYLKEYKSSGFVL